MWIGILMILLIVFIGGCEVSVKIKDVEIEDWRSNVQDWLKDNWVIVLIILACVILPALKFEDIMLGLAYIVGIVLICFVGYVILLVFGVAAVYLVGPLLEWIF